MYHNQLVGSIPSQIGHLTEVEGLCVVRPPAARPSRLLARQPIASPACAARSARVRRRSLPPPPPQLAHACARILHLHLTRASADGLLPPAVAQGLGRQPARRLDPVPDRPLDGALLLVRRAVTCCTPAHRLGCRWRASVRRRSLISSHTCSQSSHTSSTLLAHARRIAAVCTVVGQDLIHQQPLWIVADAVRPADQPGTLVRDARSTFRAFAFLPCASNAAHLICATASTFLRRANPLLHAPPALCPTPSSAAPPAAGTCLR